ncbi:hypothetical protein IT417_02445 [bacterium]|nr:hypothetical protein [bacterium]
MKQFRVATTKFLLVIGLTALLIPNLFIIWNVIADSVTTSVTVGNTSPSFTVGPAENPESSNTTPTNVGANTTFQATATDSNSENYYLILCSTNSVSATNGGAPTCGATQFCVSSSTASGSQASCNRSAQAGDAENVAWYAFVCDGNASAAACSSSSQGSGATGSPFAVNHVPGFSSVSNDGPKNPGQTVTWSTTASDTDSAGSADTVKLIVCKTTGLSGDACDGGGSDTWCSSSFVSSDPTCGYAVPTPTADGANNAYVYVVDNHNFGASSGNQGSNSSFTVNNIAPVVSGVTFNGGSAITLTEGTTTNITIGATITDNNSCTGGEIATTYGYAYRSGVGFSGCDTSGESNNNHCYAEITCTVTGGTCSGASDASADYTCTVAMQHYADPTDVATIYPTENWLASFKAIDDDSAAHTVEVSSGVEMNSLTALNVTGSVNYGTLDVNQSNDPLDKITTVTPTGNVGLDEELSGANMCTDYPTCSGGIIAVGQQKYALATSTAYASGTALTTSPVEQELNVPKATSGSPTTKNTWWGILIPLGTTPGSYSGSNTVTAVKGETGGW